MFNGKYVIGICLTRIYEVHIKRFLKSLYKVALKENVQIMVFHSLYDFFYDSVSDTGASKVFDLIDYNVVDALVVMPDSFRRPEVVDGIISEAGKHDKPVISIDRELAVDVSIMPENERTFAELLRHLFKDHKIKRPFYLSGIKGNEYNTKREKIYFQICKECNIDPDTDRYFAYGDFWREPARKAMADFFASSIPTPDAVICANDSMAIAVCDFLHEQGYDVPEDIIVTGFDGIDADNYMVPSITTCEPDYDTYAEHTVDSALRLIENMKVYSLLHVPMRVKYAESCGCFSKAARRYSGNASRLYEVMSSNDHLNAHWYRMSARILEDPGIANLKKVMFRYLPWRSAVCLNSDFVSLGNDRRNHRKIKNSFTEWMTVISAKGDNAVELAVNGFPSSKIIPTLADYEWRNLLVITAINSEDKVYGYLISDVDEFEDASRSIHHFVMNLDVSLRLVESKIMNSKLTDQVEQLSLIDSITGLPSYKGMIKKIDECYADDPERRKYRLVVSVYAIHRWPELVRDFGIEESEGALNIVKENLQKSNPVRDLIGYFAEGELILVNLFSPEDDFGRAINERVAHFYALMDRYNESAAKGYYIEVNAGCTTADPGWQGTLEDLVQIATNELIVNRLRGNAPTVAKKTADDEMVKTFLKLVDENLFYYKYQPIVDASTGEIYAYEALMRSPDEIGLSPDQILDIAASTGKLYEIEKATFFNILDEYYRRRKEFGEKKLFINSIPKIKFTPADKAILAEKFRGDRDRVVVEITEQFDKTDEQMESFVEYIDGRGWQYAIDDYGSGNSNIVNLLKFKPNLIKIDRFLISGVENDENKQMFVRNIIEFAKNNNIKVIAEGVETRQELFTMIGFGVDLIQGFYTAKPSTDVIDRLPEDKLKDIFDAKEERIKQPVI